MRLAYLMLGDRGLAEDLAQTALVKVYGTWGSIREPGSAEAYTRKTMMRLALRWRGRAWRAEVPAGLEAEEEPASQDAGDDAIVMRQALRRLPPQQRAVLVARYYLDLTEAQTADLLGCSLGTVKSRASRAMTSLRADGLLTREADQHG